MSSHVMPKRCIGLIFPIVLFLLVSILLLISGTPRGTASSAPATRGQDPALQKTTNQPALQTGLWALASDSASPNPGTLADHAMAYDSLRGRVVLFGGTSVGLPPGQLILGETWEWDGTTWKRMANTGPSPRYGHALAYDSRRQRVVLFGGQTSVGGSDRYLDDTWEWDGAAWNQVVNAGPSARSNHAMVYDSARSRIVLYGGFDGSAKSDTWERNGVVWTAINSSTGPGVRFRHAMAYDHQNQRSVLFGGLVAHGVFTANDTWEWDGTGWMQVATTGPSSRFGQAMAFDETCGKVILFGGLDQISQRDTWAWNGATWFLVADSGPPARRDHAMAYDSIRGTIVLFGGRQHLHFFRLSDTWEWRSPCDDEAAELNESGEVVLPPNVDPSEPITDEEVNQENGLVSKLYPSYDTTTDLWYKEFLCNPSIGGTIPPQALNPDLTGPLEAEGITGVTPAEITSYLSTGEQLIADVAIQELEGLSKAPAAGGSYNPPQDPHCTIKGCKYVFGGRDIVFIHGLRTNPLINKILGIEAGALTEWPQDRSEFYGTGYWKQGAESYWAEHIRKFMTDRGIRNRYLIVAYPSTQRLEIGVQAILAQIADAMQSEIGVVDPSGHNDKSKFGTPSFVIVSHSTGGLAADAAMRAAEKYPNLGVEYIPKLCKAHIALQGAFSGSRYATGAILLANYLKTKDPTPKWLCALVKLTLLAINAGGANNAMLNCPLDLRAVNSSILVDLVPLVSQLKWGRFVRDTPVRTVTVVGGHPSYLVPLKNIFHPGFDDGVLPINSQVANPNSALLWPSGYRRPSLFPARVFDMGVAGTGNLPNSGLNSPLRAINYYVDQVRDPLLNPLVTLPHPFLVASGATPYLSPTGMLQPVGGEFDLNGGFNPLRRYPNHFSFIQSASDHYKGSTGDGGFNMPFYRPTFGENNLEETRVITDSAIYSPYEMFYYSDDDQPILSEEPPEVEEVRGRKKTFTIFKKKKTVWFWKRTYHLMKGWRDKVQMDYVQELVLRDSGYACPPPDAADDCNHNGTPDECDIANGTSKDCNRNGIPDECETITIPPPGITQGPLDASVVIGQSVTFTVTVTSTVPLSYQWRKDGVNLTDDGRISGAQTSTLTINPTIPSDKGFYDVVVTGCSSVTSKPARLTFRCEIPPKLTRGIEPPTAGVPYVETLTVTGGCGSNVFDVISGTLPPGLTLSPSGTISGTPVSGSGFFSFSVRVTDACGCTDIRGYSGSVTGKVICPDPGRPYTYRAGKIDEFALPTDPAVPSAALKAAFPAATFKNFDDPKADRFLGHTFAGLPANIVKAELEVRMRPERIDSFNDAINLGFRPGSPGVVWGIQMKDLPQNASRNWNSNPAQTFTLDLANLPPSGSRPTNLIDTLAANRYLDVTIQDDTTVDYIQLRIWTCPPRRPGDGPGVPIDTTYNLVRGMNEYCIWGGGGGSYNSQTQIDSPFFGVPVRNNRGVRFGAFGLCYGRILSVHNNFAFKYTFNAIPVAGLSYPDINRDLGIPFPGSQIRRNVFGAGLSPIGFQLYFRPQSRIKPFVNTSGGFLFFKDPVPQLNGARFNFTYDFGGGVQIFRDSRRAFNFGYKYQHLSSGGRALNNSGFNAHIFYVGYSVFSAPKIAPGSDLK